MITVVTFKWHTPGYRSVFTAAHVHALRDAVRRHYAAPHRFVCVTDDARGLDGGVEVVPLWTDFAQVPSPHGAGQPSCYRRLRLFHPAIGELLGPRFVALDLDTVVCDDLAPIFDRPEDFVMWKETDPRSFYNGSLLLMNAGARPQVWERFDPARSPREALRAGRFGSDQGWISHVLGAGEATFSEADGVYSYRVHVKPHSDRLPAGARLVSFHGVTDPWSPRAQSIGWVREHYGVAA